MEPLKLTIQGTSTIYHRAERAVITIAVTSEGPAQADVSKDVTKTSNELRTILKDLALKDETGQASPDAPVTIWTMTSLSTGSQQPKDDKGKKLARQFTATTRFEVKFQNFAELGSFATTMSTMPHVNIERINWRLTDKTEASLGARSRKEAIEDAFVKANDYADGLRPGHGRVVAINLSGSYSTTSTQSYQGQKRRAGGYGHGHAHGSYEMAEAEEDELSFEPESIGHTSTVTVLFSTE